MAARQPRSSYYARLKQRVLGAIMRSWPMRRYPDTTTTMAILVALGLVIGLTVIWRFAWIILIVGWVAAMVTMAVKHDRRRAKTEKLKEKYDRTMTVVQSPALRWHWGQHQRIDERICDDCQGKVVFIDLKFVCTGCGRRG